MLKEIVKQAKLPVKNRIIQPPVVCILIGTLLLFHSSEIIVKYHDKICKLEGEVKAILKQEEEEKQLRLSEMAIKIKKDSNITSLNMSQRFCLDMDQVRGKWSRM